MEGVDSADVPGCHSDTLGPRGSGEITWTGPDSNLSSRQSSAADTWLSTDPSHASTAAIQIPRLVRLPLRA